MTELAEQIDFGLAVDIYSILNKSAQCYLTVDIDMSGASIG